MSHTSAVDKVQRRKSEKRRALYWQAVQRLLITRCLERGTATSDDAHEVKRPRSIHPSTIGAAVCGLVREKILTVAEITTTKRSAAPGRLIRRWRLADIESARQWLQVHQADAVHTVGG